MFNVTQAARYADVSATTIRGWARDYAQYFSPSANPTAGQARQFTGDDLAVFATIATLRAQLVTPDEIRAALDAGQRLEPVRPLEEEPAPTAEQPAGDQSAAGALAVWAQQVNVLQTRNDVLSDRLIEAERRIADERAARAAAERELEMVHSLYESATSPAAASTPTPGQPAPRPTFWQWITGRGRS